MTDLKPTNPKDRAAVHKLPLGLVPGSMKVFAALAFTEGDAKYGGYNWREAGVLASVYRDAMERHLESWWNGEDADPKTGIPHLASVLACAAILLDAGLAGKLEDDRPPSVPMGDLIRHLEEDVKRVREIFAEHSPRRATERDRAR
jgi:hypothetical protein